MIPITSVHLLVQRGLLHEVEFHSSTKWNFIHQPTRAQRAGGWCLIGLGIVPSLYRVRVANRSVTAPECWLRHELRSR
jgi:hypothetical protein